MLSLIADSVSSGLKLKKSRAMGLAQQKGALGTLLVNGLHAQFEPVVLFVQHMQGQSAQIGELLGSDSTLLRELLTTLSAGLVSRSRKVASESAVLMASIGRKLPTGQRGGGGGGSSGSWRWLTERAPAPKGSGTSGEMLPPVGLQAVLASVEIRSGMDGVVFEVG
jgi:hypothetical protein